MIMRRGIFMTLCAAACLASGAASAQTGMPGIGGAPIEPRQDGPLHSRYVTATGQTVPRPDLLPRDAAPLGSGRSAYEKDRRIEQSICSNC
jgi:hypothetical protein